MVGAVVVANQQNVGEGYHARFGDAHAEVVALGVADDRARGATLYVNLEPCAHHGKTPPCTEAIIGAGVRRVVAAVPDLSRTGQGGADRLRAAGIHVDLGTLRDQATELNAPFFNAQCSARPWITLKLAISADDAIAAPSGNPRWITGESARREVHRMRAGSDAIAVGLRTVLADDPALTVRDVTSPRVPPAPVIFDSGLNVPPTARLIRQARQLKTIVVARGAPAAKRRALEAAGARIIDADVLTDALRALRGAGVRSVLVEGGAALAASFLSEGAVDRLVIFRSTVRLGAGALPAFADARAMADQLARAPILERRIFDDDIMTVYGLRPVPCLPA